MPAMNMIGGLDFLYNTFKKWKTADFWPQIPQEILSKTEGLLAQLQSKFEEDIPKWNKDLDEKTEEARVKNEELEKVREKKKTSWGEWKKYI